MGDTKIRIDLSQGIIEAEGSEKFVLSIYSDFKEKIQAKLRTIQLGRYFNFYLPTSLHMRTMLLL